MLSARYQCGHFSFVDDAGCIKLHQKISERSNRKYFYNFNKFIT
jgi:hypothetical protein